jgi:hypothetical protein
VDLGGYAAQYAREQSAWLKKVRSKWVDVTRRRR